MDIAAMHEFSFYLTLHQTIFASTARSELVLAYVYQDTVQFRNYKYPNAYIYIRVTSSLFEALCFVSCPRNLLLCPHLLPLDPSAQNISVEIKDHKIRMSPRT